MHKAQNEAQKMPAQQPNLQPTLLLPSVASRGSSPASTCRHMSHTAASVKPPCRPSSQPSLTSRIARIPRPRRHSPITRSQPSEPLAVHVPITSKCRVSISPSARSTEAATRQQHGEPRSPTPPLVDSLTHAPDVLRRCSPLACYAPLQR